MKKINRRAWLKRAGIFIPSTFCIPKPKASWYYASGAAASTYLINEGFEETDSGGALGSSTDGYDSPLVVAETTAGGGSVAPDTTASPIRGSQHLQVVGVVGSDNFVEWDLGSNYSDLWIHFIKTGDSNSTRFFASGVDSSNNVAWYFGFDSNYYFTLTGGTSLTTVNYGSQTAEIWIHWVKNGTMAFWTNDANNGTRPSVTNAGAYEHAVSGGTGYDVFNRKIRLGLWNQAFTCNFDQLLVSESEIASL